MGRNTCMILVCLLLLSVVSVAAAEEPDFIEVVCNHPVPAPASPVRLPMLQCPEPVSFRQASAAPFSTRMPRLRHTPARPVVKCKPPACLPAAAPCCILPRRLPGQFEFAAQAFFARTKGTVDWAYGPTVAPSQVDLNDDLGIPAHDTLFEVIGRYQFRPKWTLHYSLMTGVLDGSGVANRQFAFGAWTFSTGTIVNSRWDFTYQRVGILFQPICTPSATVSLFNYWLFNDQKIRVTSGICGGQGSTLDRSRNMIMSGMELQKCVINLCNGATLSCDTRAGIGYLDDGAALDVQTGLQFSVPMNCNRWGFVKSGYRLLQFNESRDDLTLNSTFEGWFFEMGLIF